MIVVEKMLALAFRYRKFIKFGLVGLSNTLIALAVYYLLVAIGVHYQVANVVAFIVSSMSGFLLNRGWVFKAQGNSFFSQLIKYYIVYSGSLLISVVFSFAWIEILGINKYVAPLLNLCITIPFNYFLSKVWAFRK
jgi:putative flippase GtrA